MESNSKVATLQENQLAVKSPTCELIRCPSLSNLKPYIDITIPMRLYSEMNVREHWAKKYKRWKDQKYRLFANLIAFAPHGPYPLPCIVKLTRIAPRKFDGDNLQASFKHLRDCIAGLLIPLKNSGHADSSPLITWIYDQKKGGVREYAIQVQIYKNG